MARPGAYHQDYIARIRYSNTLPPPPNPPKLLDIPGTGLGDGQYLTAAYASKLAREQPLNIEADGELGMPIDLVGLPGVFYGDETAINALPMPPPPHAHDRPLLRPLNQLGKPVSMAQGVSFLRRTEYISSDVGRVSATGTPRANKHLPRKRKSMDAARDDDPVRMLRGIYKGFDIAYPTDAYKAPDSEERLRADAVSSEEQSAWDKPRHPTNPDLKPLDTYPVLPDLEGVAKYWILRFASNPGTATDAYDKRLDHALVHPKEPFPGANEQYTADQIAAANDPSLPRAVPPPWNYHLYLPEAQGVAALETAWDAHDSDAEDLAPVYPSHDPDTGRGFVRYSPQRVYETVNIKDYTDAPAGNTVGLALHDGEEAEDETGLGLDEERKRVMPKGAYYYPMYSRATVRPKRGAHAGDDEEAEAVDAEHRRRPYDWLSVSVKTADEDTMARRKTVLAEFIGEASEGMEVDGEENAEGEVDMGRAEE